MAVAAAALPVTAVVVADDDDVNDGCFRARGHGVQLECCRPISKATCRPAQLFPRSLLFFRSLLHHRYVNLGDIGFWRANQDDGLRDFFWQTRESNMIIKGPPAFACACACA